MTRDSSFARRLLSGACASIALAALASFAATPALAADALVLYTADGLENLYKDVLPAFEKKEGVKVKLF